MKKEICERIINIRRNMNMSKEQFGRLIGISGQYLGTVEAGVHGLSMETFISLCEKTNTSADYILFGKENISDNILRHTFDGISINQISSAFAAIQNVALFIRAKT